MATEKSGKNGNERFKYGPQNLGGQCKTGHTGSLQNRPYEMARDVILFIPLSPDQASPFWFSNSSAHI